MLPETKFKLQMTAKGRTDEEKRKKLFKYAKPAERQRRETRPKDDREGISKWVIRGGILTF